MPDPVPAGSAGTAVSPLPIQHLSWSSIQTYAQCPRKYEYRYVANAPEERTAASLAFGGAVHQALEAIHQHRMEGRSVPNHADLVSLYRAAWSEAVREKPEIIFGKGEDADTLLDLAGRILAAYLIYLDGESRSPKTIAIEHEAQFRLLPDAPPIKARVDLVEIVGDTLVVSDWKTSRSRWNDAKAAEGLGQLIVYGYALLPMLKALGVSRVVPRFVVLTKGKTVNVQVLEPKASQSDATRLKEAVSETWTAVKAGVFPRRESWACAACPYRTACLGR